jgi:uncharacterized protein with HEPN domain
MRHEASFLKDILSACRKVQAIVAMSDEVSFLSNEVLPAAVLHHLTVIGEAVSRLSVELRERHSEVPWRQIMAVRNRIVHAYFDLDCRSSGRPRLATFLNSISRFSISSRRPFRKPNSSEALELHRF